MLVLRKEVKLGLGVGAAALGIAMVYGLMAVLSANSHTPGQTSDDPSQQVAADGKSDAKSDDASVAKAGGVISGLPPKDDVKGGDPFIESTRTDGSKSDPWEQALTTGKFQTAATIVPIEKTNGFSDRGPVAPNTTPTGQSTVAQSSINQSSDVPGPIVTRAPIEVTPANNKTVTPSAKGDAPAGGGETVVGGNSYKVMPGDTFSKIAGKLYGDKRLADAIMKANPSIEPTRLRSGQTITVPAKDEVATIRGSVAPAPTRTTGTLDSSREYRVQSGDTLTRISAKLYGRRAEWEALYEQNKDEIGVDPARLKVGQVLKLSKAPTIGA